MTADKIPAARDLGDDPTTADFADNLAELHALARSGEFLEALASSVGEFGSPAANLEAACVTAWCLSRLGCDVLAFETAGETAVSAELELGAEHPVTLEALNDLARFAFRADHLEEAVTVGEDALERRRSVLGLLDPKTLTSQANVVRYRAAAGLEVAAGELDELLVLWNRVDPAGEDLTHLSALLLVAKLRGDLAGARECVACYREVCGPEHPDTVRAVLVVEGMTARMSDL